MPLPNFPGDHWVHRYRSQVRFQKHGRTFPDLDCWGLLGAILSEQCGIALPTYLGHDWDTPADRREISAFFRSQIVPEVWAPVWERTAGMPADAVVSGERPFDGVWLRPRGRNAPIHVGLVVTPGWMIHVEAGCDAVIEDYRGSGINSWRTHVEGVYRHVALCC